MIPSSNTQNENKTISYKTHPHLLKLYYNKFTHLELSKRREIESALSNLFLPNNLSKQKREALHSQMKFNDTCTLIFAFIGIVTNITSFYLYLTPKRVYDNNYVNIILIPNETHFVFAFRLITSITTIILIVLIIRHYNILLRFLKQKQQININASLYSSNLLWRLLAEVIVCIIHSPPKLNNICFTFKPLTSFSQSPPSHYKVDIDLFLSSIIPFRVYLLVKYYSFYSNWAEDRAEKICNECHSLGGISFAIKAELKERPYIMITVLMVLSILIFGFALRNVELGFMEYKPQQQFQNWATIWNGFWCIIITMLTVGYGDFYPQTFLGRIIAIIACLWGTFLISIMVVSLTNSTEFTAQEQKAYDELKNYEQQNQLKQKGLLLILRTVKLNKFFIMWENIKNNKRKYKYKYIKRVDTFKKALNDFRTYRKSVKDKENEICPENILYMLNENLNSKMENLLEMSNVHINSFIEYLKLSEGIQEENKEYINKLNIMTKGLVDCLEGNN